MSAEEVQSHHFSDGNILVTSRVHTYAGELLDVSGVELMTDEEAGRHFEHEGRTRGIAYAAVQKPDGTIGTIIQTEPNPPRPQSTM